LCHRTAVLNADVPNCRITLNCLQYSLHRVFFERIVWISVYQPSCCSGTLRKCRNHPRNPSQWSVSPAA